MALIKCSECNAEISNQAKRCPRCGIKVRRPVGPVGIMVAVIFLVLVSSSAYRSPEEARAAVDIEAAKTPEQKAEEAQYSARVHAAYTLKRAIEASAYDPDSVKFVSLRVSDDAKIVCADYRAKNAFGAMMPQIVVLKGGKGLDTTKAWNKYCTQPLNDHTPSNRY